MESFPSSFKLLLGCGFLFLASCHSKSEDTHSAKKNADPTPASFQHSMQSFKNNLVEIFPLVLNSEKFSQSGNEEKIKTSLSNLTEASKQLANHSMMIRSDPSLRFLSNGFTDDLKRAQESFTASKKEYARYLLINATSYCIECHTRTNQGPEFNSPEIESTLKNMKAIERGEFLLATRQFQPALAQFEMVISKPKDFLLMDLDKAVRYSLSITIKFLKDPELSLKVIQKILDSSQTPFYLKQSAQSWNKAIKEWKSEKKAKAPKNTAEKMKRAKILVQKGRDLQQGLGDRGGDVYFMRALSDLHAILAQKLDANNLGEALYMVGVSYESVRDLSIFNLHENYYESCIRQTAHSAWAKKCYQKLEESLYMGYTGSSGTRIPLDVQQKLDDLKKLALD